MYSPTICHNKGNDMVEIKISIPIGIGSVDVAQINLPVEKIVGKLLRSNAEPILAGNLVAWCFQKVLDDQYTKGDAAGAWSRRYPEYIKFLYNGDIPSDVSWRESITISAQIAAALIQYSNKFPNENITKTISQRLKLFKDYLKRHYSAELGGVGLATSGKYRGSPGISVDIRHTAWAVIALWHLGVQDSEIKEMFYSATRYISSKIESDCRTIDKYALTYAALHQILTTNKLSSVIMPSVQSCRSAQKRIEGILIDKFVREYKSWDLDDLRDDPRVSIDNALSVLEPIQISSCIDSECSKVLKVALNHLYESLQPVGNKMMALPFCEEGEPDIGATIELLWCIAKNQDVFKPKRNRVKKMINYIVDPLRQENNDKFAYPWNLSSALLLATKSQ